MKCLFIRLIPLVFLCDFGFTQSMELENLSKKAVYGATSQSKPLQKMPFHPVGSGLDTTLNRLIKLEHRCVEGFYIRIEQQLPVELWEKIWSYLNRRDKLRFGSLAHSFEYIRSYVQLDVCREKLLRGEYSDYHSFYDFYRCTKKICDLCEDTKIDAVKTRGKMLLEDNKIQAQAVIAENEPWIKSQRHYTQTENYKKLKYLNEVFNEPNTCYVWCIECDDECCDTAKDCIWVSIIDCCSCLCKACKACECFDSTNDDCAV